MSQPAVFFKWDTRQVIKIAVYALLLVNFVFYVLDDIEYASHSMRNGGSLLDWTRIFATSIDVFAWITILLLFELETYALADQVRSRPGMKRLFRVVRLLLYPFLAHSVYAYGIIYWDLMQAEIVAGVSNLCQLVAADVTFVRNLELTRLTLENCGGLSVAGRFFYVEPGLVVSDAMGLALEQRLALADLLEVIAWLLILLTIEVMVRLQDRSTTRGSLVRLMKSTKLVLYPVLCGIAAWWVTLGHYYFAWDEVIWVIGYLTIEANMTEWKREIEDRQVLPADWA